MGQQVVLGQSMDLLPFASLRQTGHFIAIPSHLPTDNVPQSQLRADRFHICVLMLDCVQRRLQLYACQLLLESRHRSGCERNVLEPTGCLVSNILSGTEGRC